MVIVVVTVMSEFYSCNTATSVLVSFCYRAFGAHFNRIVSNHDDDNDRYVDDDDDADGDDITTRMTTTTRCAREWEFPFRWDSHVNGSSSGY